jgi:hypothetical protein
VDDLAGGRRELLDGDGGGAGNPGGDDDGGDDAGRRLDALAQRLEGRIRRARDRSAARPRPEGAEDRSGATDAASNP